MNRTDLIILATLLNQQGEYIVNGNPKPTIMDSRLAATSAKMDRFKILVSLVLFLNFVSVSLIYRMLRHTIIRMPTELETMSLIVLYMLSWSRSN